MCNISISPRSPGPKQQARGRPRRADPRSWRGRSFIIIRNDSNNILYLIIYDNINTTTTTTTDATTTTTTK